MNKFLSRKFLVAVFTIALCVAAYIFGDTTVKLISVVAGGIVAICYILAETMTDVYKDEEIIEHRIIGFKEENDESIH